MDANVHSFTKPPPTLQTLKHDSYDSEFATKLKENGYMWTSLEEILKQAAAFVASTSGLIPLSASSPPRPRTSSYDLPTVITPTSFDLGLSQSSPDQTSSVKPITTKWGDIIVEPYDPELNQEGKSHNIKPQTDAPGESRFMSQIKALKRMAGKLTNRDKRSVPEVSFNETLLNEISQGYVNPREQILETLTRDSNLELVSMDHETFLRLLEAHLQLTESTEALRHLLLLLDGSSGADNQLVEKCIDAAGSIDEKIHITRVIARVQDVRASILAKNPDVPALERMLLDIFGDEEETAEMLGVIAESVCEIYYSERCGENSSNLSKIRKVKRSTLELSDYPLYPIIIPQKIESLWNRQTLRELGIGNSIALRELASQAEIIDSYDKVIHRYQNPSSKSIYYFLGQNSNRKVFFTLETAKDILKLLRYAFPGANIRAPMSVLEGDPSVTQNHPVNYSTPILEELVKGNIDRVDLFADIITDATDRIHLLQTMRYDYIIDSSPYVRLMDNPVDVDDLRPFYTLLGTAEFFCEALNRFRVHHFYLPPSLFADLEMEIYFDIIFVHLDDLSSAVDKIRRRDHLVYTNETFYEDIEVIEEFIAGIYTIHSSIFGHDSLTDSELAYHAKSPASFILYYETLLSDNEPQIVNVDAALSFYENILDKVTEYNSKLILLAKRGGELCLMKREKCDLKPEKDICASYRDLDSSEKELFSIFMFEHSFLEACRKYTMNPERYKITTLSMIPEEEVDRIEKSHEVSTTNLKRSKRSLGFLSFIRNAFVRIFRRIRPPFRSYNPIPRLTKYTRLRTSSVSSRGIRPRYSSPAREYGTSSFNFKFKTPINKFFSRRRRSYDTLGATKSKIPDRLGPKPGSRKPGGKDRKPNSKRRCKRAASGSGSDYGSCFDYDPNDPTRLYTGTIHKNTGNGNRFNDLTAPDNTNMVSPMSRADSQTLTHAQVNHIASRTALPRSRSPSARRHELKMDQAELGHSLRDTNPLRPQGTPRNFPDNTNFFPSHVQSQGQIAKVSPVPNLKDSASRTVTKNFEKYDNFNLAGDPGKMIQSPPMSPPPSAGVGYSPTISGGLKEYFLNPQYANTNPFNKFSNTFYKPPGKTHLYNSPSGRTLAVPKMKKFNQRKRNFKSTKHKSERKVKSDPEVSEAESSKPSPGKQRKLDKDGSSDSFETPNSQRRNNPSSRHTDGYHSDPEMSPIRRPDSRSPSRETASSRTGSNSGSNSATNGRTPDLDSNPSSNPVSANVNPLVPAAPATQGDPSWWQTIQNSDFVKMLSGKGMAAATILGVSTFSGTSIAQTSLEFKRHNWEKNTTHAEQKEHEKKNRWEREMGEREYNDKMARERKLMISDKWAKLLEVMSGHAVVDDRALNKTLTKFPIETTNMSVLVREMLKNVKDIGVKMGRILTPEAQETVDELRRSNQLVQATNVAQADINTDQQIQLTQYGNRLDELERKSRAKDQSPDVSIEGTVNIPLSIVTTKGDDFNLNDFWDLVKDRKDNVTQISELIDTWLGLDFEIRKNGMKAITGSKLAENVRSQQAFELKNVLNHCAGLQQCVGDTTTMLAKMIRTLSLENSYYNSKLLRDEVQDIGERNPDNMFKKFKKIYDKFSEPRKRKTILDLGSLKIGLETKNKSPDFLTNLLRRVIVAFTNAIGFYDLFDPEDHQHRLNQQDENMSD